MPQANQSAFHLCPKFYKTFTMLGKKWNGLIIEALICEGPLRFKNLSKIIRKCSDRVMVERLRELCQCGIVKRNTYHNSSLIEYSLTTKGRELKPIMKTVHQWSDKWCQCCHHDD